MPSQPLNSPKGLRSEKWALLSQLSRHSAHPSSLYKPLTHRQQALWLTNQLSPHNWTNHITFSARIHSDVEPLALQPACQMFTHHSTLQTTYPLYQGTPRQIVHPNPDIDFAAVECPDQNSACIREQTLNESCRSLDLKHGPLIYARLFSRSAKKLPSSIPIGSPIANTQLCMLDDYLQPVPIGIIRELYLGSMGVARGYLNQQALTPAKLIHKPFSENPGSQLHKTGDRPRYLPDGNLHFIGPADDQINLRGFRVQLDAIEAVLRRHLAVSKATTAIREAAPDDKCIVAYWFSEPCMVPSSHDLRQVLQERWPRHIESSALVKLDTLTPYGKIDQGQFPTPASLSPQAVRDQTPPYSQTDIIVVQLLADTLNVKTVGRYDNFFDLGGLSLLPAQLMSCIQERLQSDIPLRQLFDTSTVTELAQAVDAIHQRGPTNLATVGPTIECQAKVTLASTILPTTDQSRADSQHPLTPQSVMLTGGTSFPETYLLHELLRYTQANIYCLVRADTTEQGQRRQQYNLAHYTLSPRGIEARLIPLLADLSQSGLGLSSQHLHQLADDIDIIYHKGSVVNFISPYSELKAANVPDTQDILQLASRITVKPAHYISTIALFDWTSYTALTHIREPKPLHWDRNLFNGYIQSKLVAALVVSQAHDQGLPLSIYLPATINGHTQTGRVNTEDLECCLIKGSIQLGSIPTVDIKSGWVPVNYVSQAIVHLSQQMDPIGNGFHPVNPHSFHLHQLAHALRAYSYPLTTAPYPFWLAQLKALAECDIDNVLHHSLSLLTDHIAPFILAVPELYTHDQRPQLDCDNTMADLRTTVLTCPPIHRVLIEIHLDCLIQSQSLPPPSHQPRSRVSPILDKQRYKRTRRLQ